MNVSTFFSNPRDARAADTGQALSLSGVSYRHANGHVALRDIALRIGQGERVALIGPSGAGKTTLSTKLGKHFGWIVHHESTENNPYLSDFYNDMRRWAFNLQIFFLNSRYQQVLKILSGSTTVVQDRTIYEDAEIFCTNLFRSRRLSKRDFQTYMELYRTMSQALEPPDLMIYLRCSVRAIRKRIRQRGRKMEQNIPLSYLRRIDELYDAIYRSLVQAEQGGGLLFGGVAALDRLVQQALRVALAALGVLPAGVQQHDLDAQPGQIVGHIAGRTADRDPHKAGGAAVQGQRPVGPAFRVDPGRANDQHVWTTRYFFGHPFSSP